MRRQVHIGWVLRERRRLADADIVGVSNNANLEVRCSIAVEDVSELRHDCRSLGAQLRATRVEGHVALEANDSGLGVEHENVGVHLDKLADLHLHIGRKLGLPDLRDQRVDVLLHLRHFSGISAALDRSDAGHRLAELLAQHVFVGTRGVEFILHLKELLLLGAIGGHEVVVLGLRDAASEREECGTDDGDE